MLLTLSSCMTDTVIGTTESRVAARSPHNFLFSFPDKHSETETQSDFTTITLRLCLVDSNA